MSWVVTREIDKEGFKVLAVVSDEKAAKKYVDSFEHFAPIGNRYLYWEVDDLTEEDIRSMAELEEIFHVG